MNMLSDIGKCVCTDPLEANILNKFTLKLKTIWKKEELPTFPSAWPCKYEFPRPIVTHPVCSSGLQITKSIVMSKFRCSSLEINMVCFVVEKERGEEREGVGGLMERLFFVVLLPARASEQGNVIGLVSVYIYVIKKIVIERTRDLIYLKFVATDFSPKIINPMLVKTPVTQRSPCYSVVSAFLMNPLPYCSNNSPLCHTHYLTPDQYFTSLFRPDPLPSRELETNTSKFNAAALYCRI